MRVLALLCTAVLVAGLPAGASASVVSVERHDAWDGEPVYELWLHYTALVGEENRVRVETAPDGRLLLSDAGVKRIFEDEAICEQLTPQQVACGDDPDDFLSEVAIVLGDGADRALVLSSDLDPGPDVGTSRLPVMLDGGSGDDLLRSRVLYARIYGREGDDRISATHERVRPPSNYVSCGRGRDRAVVPRSFYNPRRDCERLVRRQRSGSSPSMRSTSPASSMWFR